VAVRALKKAEDSDEIVVRVQELYGRPVETRIKFARTIRSVREINAAEESVGALSVQGDSLPIELKAYQPRAFALRFQTPAVQSWMSSASVPLDLPFNLDGVSTDTNRADGDFDGKGQTLAGELLPQKLQLDGLWFKFGSSSPGALNVLVPNGQSVPVSPGSYNRVYILATAVGSDILTTIAGEPLTVSEWQGPIGQWDSRLKEPRQLREVHVAQITRGQSWTADDIQKDLVVSYDPASGIVSGIDQIRRGFVKRDEIAWIGTHRHAPEGNEPYIASYLFAYVINLPKGARAIRLPNNDRIRILAITATRQPFRLWPATALYAADLPNR
jgi:alpha-mannosidase